MIFDSSIIVNNLHKYLLILNGVEEQEQMYFEEIGKLEFSFQKSMSLSYNSITAFLNTKSESERFSRNYVACSFKIEDEKVLLTYVKCENSGRENLIKAYILQHAPSKFPSIYNANIFDKEIVRYLSIADEIAKRGYSCSSRDDYYPGYFSEIIVEDFMIILKQINHWNSRSLNHKNDYHLRDLEFYIPIGVTGTKDFLGSEKIGQMVVLFSDRSSENNKKCGEQIFQKLQEQKLLFENGDMN